MFPCTKDAADAALGYALVASKRQEKGKEEVVSVNVLMFVSSTGMCDALQK
jgi:hypothetical protein